MVLRNSSCREQGNLLATAKWALPRHTASHDLLKKHNGASSPHSSLFISHLPPPSICQFLISILWPPFSLSHFPFFWPTIPVVLSAIQQISSPLQTALELLHSQLVSIDFNVRALTSLIQTHKVSPFVLIYLQRNSICISRRQNKWRYNLPKQTFTICYAVELLHLWMLLNLTSAVYFVLVWDCEAWNAQQVIITAWWTSCKHRHAFNASTHAHIPVGEFT